MVQNYAPNAAIGWELNAANVQNAAMTILLRIRRGAFVKRQKKNAQ